MREEHLIREFIAEAEDYLLLLEPQLLQLEKEPDNADLLQEIFVATHAIKGTASYVGLAHISEFTHLLESVLDRLRKREMRVSPDLIDVLLQAVDSIKRLIQHVSAGKPPHDTSDIEKTLAHWHNPAPPLSSELKRNSERSEFSQSMVFPVDELQTLDPEDLEIFADIASQQLECMRLSWENLRKTSDNSVDLSKGTLKSAAASLVKAFRTIQSSAAMLGITALDDSLAEQAEAIALFDSPITVAKHDFERVSQAIEHLEHLVTAFSDLGRKTDESLESSQTASLPAPSEGFPTDTLVSPHVLRVDSERVDALLHLVGELVVNRARLVRIEKSIKFLYDDLRTGTASFLNPPPAYRKKTVRLFKKLKDLLDETTMDLGRLTNQFQEGAMRIRMIPISQVVSRFPRMVRDLARQSGKEVTIEIQGADTELDKSVMDIIADPLIHLLRNAVDHGIESPDERRAQRKDPQGHIVLSAFHQGNQVLITLQDDGRGIDVDRVKQKALEQQILSADGANTLSEKALAALIFRTGLSTLDTASSLSGRGVGLHLVQRYIEQLNGTVELETTPGEGTTFILKLPLTLAIIPALMVGVKAEVFAIPLVAVEEAIRITAQEINTIESCEVVRLREKTIPLVRLSELLGEPASEMMSVGWGAQDLELPASDHETHFEESFLEPEEQTLSGVIISDNGRELGLIIDRFIGENDIVITALKHDLVNVEGVSGASIQPDGRVAFVLDAASLLRLADRRIRENKRSGALTRLR